MSFPSGRKKVNQEAHQLSSTGCAAKSCPELLSITHSAQWVFLSSCPSPHQCFREHPMLELKDVGESLKQGASEMKCCW